MNNVIYVCLDDDCVKADCENYKTNAFIKVGRQYGYFRHTNICPLYAEERKEKENEENILLKYRSATNNRNSDSLYILREEEAQGSGNTGNRDGNSCTICEYNCCE